MSLREDISKITTGLVSASWKERNYALSTLSGITQLKELIDILEAIEAENKEYSAQNLLRELTRFVPTIQIELIKYFYHNLPSDAIVENLLLGLQKLPTKSKLELALEFLQKSNNSVVLQACIKILGDAKEEKSVFLLLERYHGFTDIQLIRSVHNAFRKLLDVRVVSHLILQLNNHSKIEPAVLFEILLTLQELGKLYKVNPGIYKEFLKHSHFKIRKVAVLCISNYSKEKYYNQVLKILPQEKDLRVRQEIIKHTPAFPNKNNVLLLLSLLEKSEDDSEILAIESALESFPEKVKRDLFHKIIKKQTPRTRCILCRELAKLEDQNDIPLFKYLFQKDSDDMVKAQAAEALAVFKDEKIDKLFSLSISKNPALSYGVVMALCQHQYEEKQNIYDEILNFTGVGLEIVHQTILANLPLFLRKYSISDNLNRTLKLKLNDENTNIRYLATIALAHTRDVRIINELFECLKKEIVPENIIELNKTIRIQIGSNYNYLLSLIEENPDNTLFGCTIILEMNLSQSEKFSLMMQLLKKLIDQKEFDTFLTHLDNYPHLIPDYELFIRILLEFKSERENVLKIIDFINRHRLEELNSELSYNLFKYFESSDSEIKEHLCSFFTFTPQLTNELFYAWHSESSPLVKTRLHETLLELCRIKNG